MVKTLEPMTTGSISKRMIAFALPLLLGNLFQQLYNTVDSLIVGNFLGSSALAAFDSNPEVIRFGVEKARTAALFYCLLAYSHSVASVLRGAGKAVVPMLIMMTFWCVVRVTFLSISIPMTHSIQMVYLVYPLTWSLSSIAFFFYYKKANWMDLTDAGGAKQAG